MIWSKKHGVTPAEAQIRCHRLVEDFAARYPKLKIKVTWLDRGARAKGRGFDATFDVGAEAVDVNVSLGLVARPFKAKIEARMVENLNEAFPDGPAL